MTNVTLKKYTTWMNSEHKIAIKMWKEGASVREIGEAVGRSSRGIDYYTRTNRDQFPRRRAPKSPKGTKARITLEISLEEMGLLKEAATIRGLSTAIMIRNALLLAKQHDWPLIDREAFLNPVEEVKKPNKPEVKKPAPKKVPYAGSPKRY